MTATYASEPSAPAGPGVSRRQMLRFTGLLAAAAFTGCAPVRIALRMASAEYATGGDRVARTLRAFVATVLPGADPGSADPARVLTDAAYPFAPYAGTFAADLDSRARRLFGLGRFDVLEPEQRTRVVEDGLRADGATRRLYAGAVFISQVANYAGIYGDDGCELIGFEGRYRLRPLDELRHPDMAGFAANETSPDGNPV